MELANDSHFGLSGAIFTNDVDRARKLASRLETGSVWINTRSGTSPELPFGGVERSGYGGELSEYGIKEFVNQKMVVVAFAIEQPDDADIDEIVLRPTAQEF